MPGQEWALLGTLPPGLEPDWPSGLLCDWEVPPILPLQSRVGDTEQVFGLSSYFLLILNDS